MYSAREAPGEKSLHLALQYFAPRVGHLPGMQTISCLLLLLTVCNGRSAFLVLNRFEREEELWDRRTFFKSVAIGTMAAGVAGQIHAAEKYFPSKVDPSLFETVNRVKNPSSKTPLEKGHAPVIKAPQTVKAGEPFTVDVSVGEVIHPMGRPHWIEFIELNIGPACRQDGFSVQGVTESKDDLHYNLDKRICSFRQGHAHRP